MTDKNSLRIKAEKLLQKKGVNSELYQKDLESLVEELSIFQIELEHQNQELKTSQEDLEKTKEKYADLFNQAPTGYFILDSEMNIQEVNKTACMLLNTQPGKLLNKRFNSLIHPDFQNKMHFCRTSLENNMDMRCDLKLKKDNETYFYARVLGNPVHKKNKTYRIAVIDITNEKLLEIKLQQETEIAQRNEKLKSTFLANMSHEIRTPLNGILGFSQLLTTPNLEKEKMQQFAQIVNDSGHRLLNLINNVLEMSKIESGSETVSKIKFNLVNEVKSIIELFIAAARTKELTIKLLVNENDEVLKNFYSDQMKIAQILSNLLNNAIKFSQNGDITIRVDVNGKYTTISVNDKGIGIEPEKWTKVFEPYYQDTENDSNAVGGTGLGLTICKKLTEMLGGKIWVESQPANGSTFYFTVPIEKQQVST